VGWTIKPGAPTGDVLGADEVEGGAVLGAEFAVVFEPDFDFCAQGGRLELSWLKATPLKTKAKTAKYIAGRKRWGVILISY